MKEVISCNGVGLGYVIDGHSSYYNTTGIWICIEKLDEKIFIPNVRLGKEMNSSGLGASIAQFVRYYLIHRSIFTENDFKTAIFLH